MKPAPFRRGDLDTRSPGPAGPPISPRRPCLPCRRVHPQGHRPTMRPAVLRFRGSTALGRRARSRRARAPRRRPDRMRRPRPRNSEAFSRLMRDKMRTGDVHARKDVIRSVVSGITVGDGRIRIIGDRTVLAAAVSGQRTRYGFVRGFVREWRALRESNPSLQRERLPS